VGLIYVDSCLIIYLVERHAKWGKLIADVIAETPDMRLGLSPLVKCECLVGPIKRGDPILQRAYEEMFSLFATLAMPEAVYLQPPRCGRVSESKRRMRCIWPVRNITAATHYGRMMTG
jgi:hypothetical protein